jgi:membrane protein YqaA with SNARE-associated domain
MREWFKRFKIQSLSQPDTKWDARLLFILAFIDASFLPLPAQTLFLFLILMNSSKSVRYIIFGSLGTFAGALAGYLIGHFAILNIHGEYTGLVKFLFDNIPGFSESDYNRMQILYSKWDFWILFIASFTPVPYGMFAISSGVFEINLFIFCIATFFSQTLKFIILAFVTAKLGPQVRKIIEFNLKPIAIITLICIAIIILVT